MPTTANDDSRRLSVMTRLYLTACEGRVTKKTIVDKRCNLRRFIRHADYGITIDEINSASIDAICSEMETRHSPKTIRETVKSLRTLFAWLKSQKLLECDPMDAYKFERRRLALQGHVSHKRVSKKAAWTDAEFARVVAVCDSLARTVIRHGEPVPLCIYFGCLVRMVDETGLRKRGLFALTQEVVRNDQTINRKTRELFHSLPGTYPLHWQNKRSFYGRWKRICEDADVPDGAIEMIRHTAAIACGLNHPSGGRGQHASCQKGNR